MPGAFPRDVGCDVAIDNLVRRGLFAIAHKLCAHNKVGAEVLEEDELEILAKYHLEKFKNWMRPLMDPDAISSEITIQMPPVKLPASKK